VDEDFAVFNEVKKVYMDAGDFHLQQLLKFITHSSRPSVSIGMKDAKKHFIFFKKMKSNKFNFFHFYQKSSFVQIPLKSDILIFSLIMVRVAHFVHLVTPLTRSKYSLSSVCGTVARAWNFYS